MKTMKTLILGAVAVSVAAAPAAAAPFGRHDGRAVQRAQVTKIVHRDNGRQVVKVKQVTRTQSQARNWRKGDRFDSRHARNYRVVSNYRDYRLQAPPRGYRYVQSDDNVLLVAIASGLVGAVFGNIL